MNSSLKENFIALLSNYSIDPILINELWNEIMVAYSGKKRYYHNLTHLENLLEQLLAVKTNIYHWNTILFTLYYHDVIYNASKNDNEEKSAALAEKRMQQLGVPVEITLQCRAQILATKKHEVSADTDTNYFTDADLSVLGQPWEVYEAYHKNVRKEYSIYPDILYIPGRKKVLRHFLSMERIFKTGYFFSKFESVAKDNLQKELNILSS